MSAFCRTSLNQLLKSFLHSSRFATVSPLGIIDFGGLSIYLATGSIVSSFLEFAATVKFYILTILLNWN